MPTTTAEKAERFRNLHLGTDCFVMPNAWNAGTARALEAAGFAAIGTTSAGIAFANALPDYEGALGLERALKENGRICAATDLPVSADSEDGYGIDAAGVADAIGRFVDAGVVGVSIEDHPGKRGAGLYERDVAVERVRAARAAADSASIALTLTARAECYLVGHDDPLRESVERCNRYREAGADCLYVPGVSDPDAIATLVCEIDGPINVLVGPSGPPLTVAQLQDLGVRRISIGGSLARATFGLIRRAAQELLGPGTFSFADGQVSHKELCEMMSR